MTQHSSRRMAMNNAVKYGAIAGSIATWTISTAVAGSELELGLPIGTFYSIIGISLGLDYSNRYYIRSSNWSHCDQTDHKEYAKPTEGTLIGIGGGVVVWLILFLPITALLVHPAINNIVILSAIESKHVVFSVDINQSIRNIALSAIVFHLIWGAIFGIITSSLIRASYAQVSLWSRVLGRERRKEGTIKQTIRLVSEKDRRV